MFIACPDQGERVHEPALKANLCNELLKDVRPLRLAFDIGVIRLTTPTPAEGPDDWEEYDLDRSQARVEREAIKASQIMYGCFEELA